MIRIRFHGRGGHGVKTAGRIVGTAAFLAGLQVQDSPMYGAERRGAAVAAFTRIDSRPILERGAISHPDLIIVADETLLADPAVLDGQAEASAVFLNTTHAEPCIREHHITATVASYDVTGRSLAVLGRASALSAGLAAAAARLTGQVTAEHLQKSIQAELSELGVSADQIARNQALAAEVFASLPTAVFRGGSRPSVAEMVQIAYHGPLHGTPSILNPGNAQLQHTGSWRVERPTIDRELCTRCGLCAVRCPDGAIALDEQGYPVIDYDHCKGCLICRHECPVLAIGGVRETQAW